MMTTDQRRDRGALLIFAIGCLATAILSVGLGQSTSWDLRNYHWYNPYALLHGRMGFDMAVGHHATFYNPLIDVPLWLVGNAVPGWVAAAFLGLVQGLNFGFLYVIARDAIAPEVAARHLIAFLVALVGVLGGYAVVLVGTTYYDNVVSIPILAGLWLLIRHGTLMDAGAWKDAKWPAIWAGLLVGIAVGLKLPTAPFGLAIIVALAVLPGRAAGARRLALVAAGGLAAFVGLMLATGWWFFILWHETGNPLFPYFNDVIGSKLIMSASYRDTRYLPKSAYEALAFPFRFALNWQVSSDWPVNDWQVAVAYVAIPLGALISLIGARSNAAWVTRRATRVLWSFAAAAYLTWLAVFAIFRYITPLEMLAPLLIFAAIGLFPLPKIARWATAVVVLGGIALTTTHYLGDRTRFSDRVIEAKIPPIARPDQTMAVMTGLEPLSFLIPSFPPQIPFLRIDSYMVTPADRTPYLQRMDDRIKAHLAAGGDLFSLYAANEEQRGDQALALMGLKRTDDCADIWNNLLQPPDFRYRWCRVVAAGGT